ncbi:MAG: sporulation protein YunB [Clostridia bacterium]|nr:sporulation protein YunB [Clostridia bacterium]
MKRRRKFRLIALAILLLLGGVVLYAQRNVTRVLISVSEATIRSITTVAVNDAIYYTLSDNFRYEDLVDVERDESGEITAISSNVFQINRIARDTAYLSQENLNKMSEEGVYLPLGSLTGIEMLAGMGPKINFKILPISNVQTRFLSDFTSSGINQTKHSIYLEVVADISIILPTTTTTLASTTQVLICESVLIGRVPEMYLQSSLFDERYELSPR